MVKVGLENKLIRVLKLSTRPQSTRELSIKLGVAWHTVDRHCLKLKIKNRVDFFIIGKSTAWFLKEVSKK